MELPPEEKKPALAQVANSQTSKDWQYGNKEKEV